MFAFVGTELIGNSTLLFRLMSLRKITGANPKDLRGLLPKKPPVAWAELPVEIQREIQIMHDGAESEGVTERTLKKRVRQYLVDQFIIEE